MLNDTTLAAIVRDEEHNPAHGIEQWLHATLPFVERAVIVDTGSVDGTLGILERAKRRFGHLEVYERPFDDFASSRNFSLGKVTTPLALILDADELIMPDEFKALSQFMETYRGRAYHFWFKEIFDVEHVNDNPGFVHNYRVINPTGIRFRNIRNGYSEWIQPDEKMDYPIVVPNAVTTIKHFKSPKEASNSKITEWYEQENFKTQTPLSHAQKFGWKQKNPTREYFTDPKKLIEAGKSHPKLVRGTLHEEREELKLAQY